MLRSIRLLASRCKPTLIAECYVEATPDERQELCYVVADQGYDLYYFADFDEQPQRIKLSTSDMNCWENFNFYAVPR